MANDITPYRFRSFGEIVCFLPLALVGIVLFFSVKAGLREEVATWIWGGTFVVCMQASCVDWNWLVTLVIAVILYLLVIAGKYFGFVFQPVVDFLFPADALINTKFMLFSSYVILIYFIVIWIANRISYYEVSPNQVESVVAGQKDWTENMQQVSLIAKYDNFLKLLLFGMGNVVIERNGQSIRVIDDIPFLLWWRWSYIEAMRRQMAVTVVTGPGPTPAP